MAKATILYGLLMIALGVGALFIAISTDTSPPLSTPISPATPSTTPLDDAAPATLPTTQAAANPAEQALLAAQHQVEELATQPPARTSNPIVRKVTSTIPAWLGLPALVLGWLALNPSYRKHAMHAAVIIGLLGVLGGLGMGLPPGIKWLLGTEPARPLATVVQLLMGVFSLVFVVLCVQSFIAARKARLA